MADVKITYLGHSCFKIEGSAGSLVCDPYDPSMGYGDLHAEANVVTASHTHYDHGYFEAVKVVDPDSQSFKIEKYETFHDDAGGSKRGINIVHIFETDGLRICHLGDLGHMLSDDQISAMGRIDLLMPPIGGNYTITGTQAAELCRKINPKYIIPMHYKVPCAKIDISDEQEFIGAISGDYPITHCDGCEITISPSLNGGIYFLQYRGN